MPFGLSIAPATFQRAMELALARVTFTMCLCYFDDVIVFGRNIDEHNIGLAAVLSRFGQHNLRVKLSKCKFAARTVTYLGHQISQHGVSPDPTKIAAVRDMPTPRSIKDVRSFLGLAGYYRRFVPNFASVSAPLTRLTQKHVSFRWTDECERSFQQLKELLCSSSILVQPQFDREFILQTDVSDFTGLEPYSLKSTTMAVKRWLPFHHALCPPWT